MQPKTSPPPTVKQSPKLVFKELPSESDTTALFKQISEEGFEKERQEFEKEEKPDNKS